MPILKVLNKNGSHKNKDAKEKLYNYMTEPRKTPHQLIGTVAIESDVVEEMNQVAEQYHKNFGIQVRHFIVSYSKKETKNPAVVAAIAQEVASYLGQRYQTVYAVHEDSKNLHFHIMFNPASYVDGYKYAGTETDHHNLVNAIKAAGHRFGIRGLSYVSTQSSDDIQ